MSLGKVFATTTVSSAVIVMGLLASGVHGADAVGKQGAAKAAAVTTVPGMPPVPNPANLYSETGADHIAPAVRDDLERIYVPNLRSNDVYVIDPAKMKVVDKFKVGPAPQHVVPSWDLRTLWVANNAERRTDGSLTPIDPRTGKPGKEILVDDPYNVYATPDGASLIVVAEAKHRLDFRDPKTLALQYAIDVPKCGGINHADFSIDGRYAIFTCEFQGSVAKIDLGKREVLGYLKLDAQDPLQGRAKTQRPECVADGDRGLLGHQGHAAGHPHLARRQALLRGRHGGRRGARARW